MKKTILSALLLATLAPVAALAGDWSGSLGASLLVTDGNSQSRSIGGKVNVVDAADRRPVFAQL